QRNFDYRLAFLLLTVPQLLHWARAGQRLAFLTIAALLVTVWLDVWSTMPAVGSLLIRWRNLTAIGPHGQMLPFAVVSQYVLFATLAAWIIATAPTIFRRSAAGCG